MNIQVSPSSIPNSTQTNLSNGHLNKDVYLNGLLDKVSVIKTEGWLQELKDNAANWVRHSTLPTKKDEEWRFTDLSALRQLDFNLETNNSVSPDFADFTAISDTRLVFVNGVFVKELSAIANLPDGVVVSNLSGLPNLDGELVKQYLAQSEGAKEVFTALNTAGIKDVAVIWLSRNVVVETPIHLVFITTGNQIISQPRCLVVAKSGSEVTFVEEFINGSTGEEDKQVYLNNVVTEIWVDENAGVNHTRIENDSVEAFHIGKTAVTQARNSRYTCNAITLGGKLSRHNLEILQTGEQTETTLNGLTIISGNQLSDTHSALALNHPYSNSKQLQKNIIGGKAYGIFNGKIFVPKPAQLTDASQLNRNLLLSPQARVDTKPQLEITADNVKCAHGATVSQLEDDEIFYLQSRGINENNARHLLINAFAAEIINQIPVPSLRQNLTQTANRF
ncbi:Fe-S cluster assembly protein SufD [Plectonema cf. radiosum LEGE 06105]|uniref:Fe-S cluster assembly protein SufD n=1 Tax=Plectonema cf. radiosum LEGE 06105 TaxID=945769 RepID=A0A8J7F2E9_9CYAN|nr:Fe-S cluster assembly protein SufD [Plectonema radiosum]MBE9212568.1 Fe-S cluster assembly protein SufD [Plectonema cf. radiosum LEGE 06105]